jgi:hypothetical protein
LTYFDCHLGSGLYSIFIHVFIHQGLEGLEGELEDMEAAEPKLSRNGTSSSFKDQDEEGDEELNNGRDGTVGSIDNDLKGDGDGSSSVMAGGKHSRSFGRESKGVGVEDKLVVADEK